MEFDQWNCYFKKFGVKHLFGKNYFSQNLKTDIPALYSIIIIERSFFKVWQLIHAIID